MKTKISLFLLTINFLISSSERASAQCVQQICPYNLINNEGFESVEGTLNCGQLLYNSDNALSCWEVYSDTPDLFSTSCTGEFGIPNAYWTDDVENTFNSEPDNTRFLGLLATCPAGITDCPEMQEEGLQNILSTPIIQNHTYEVSFRIRTCDGFLVEPAPVQISVGGAESELNFAFCYDPLATGLTHFGSIPVQYLNGWQYVSFEFTYSGANDLNSFILAHDCPSNLDPEDEYVRYVFIDDVKLVDVSISESFFGTIQPLCIDGDPILLSDFVNTPGGSFSSASPGFYAIGDQFYFDPELAGPGIHSITYFFEGIGECQANDEVEILVLEECCVNTSTATTISTQPEANAYSNGSFFFPGDLIVDCDQCEIENSNLYFAPNAQCLIKEGSVALFNQCLFSACETNWNRIYVAGNSSTTAVSAELLLNECTIEYAFNAIDTRDASSGLAFLPATQWQGGRVRASGCTFSNNLRSFRKEFSSKEATFMDCNFYVDDELTTRFPGASFSEIVYLHKSRVNKFLGCNFENAKENVVNWGSRRRGIYARKSQLIVWGEIESGTNYLNSFKGFQYGVFAVATTSKAWAGVAVRDMRFTQNRIGLYGYNLIAHDFYRNRFEIGIPTLNPVLDLTLQYEGARVQFGAGFQVAENICTGLDADAEYRTHGIVTINTNSNDEEIYHNYLDNLTAGNVANGDNFTSVAEGGLRYECNQNTNNTVIDIAVANGTELEDSNDGIGMQQFGEGSTDEIEISAGNSFTDWATPPFLDSHFRNNGANVITYWCNGDCPEYYNPDDLDIFFIGVDDNQCTTLVQIVGDDGEINQALLNTWKNRAVEAKSDYISARYLHLSLVDGGETEELKEEVEEAWSGDTWEMREELLSRSPNLSRDVLMRVADNTTTFPHPIALEIFMANPQILLDNSFMSYLETKADPLPEYMIDILWDMRDEGIVTSLVEQNMRISRAAYQQARTRVIRAMLAAENPNWTEIDQYFDELETLNTEFLIIESLIEAGDFVESQNRYTAIPDVIRLSDLDLRNYDMFGEWINLRIELRSANVEFDNLNASQLTLLTDWADNNPSTYAGANACDILNEYYGGEYFMEPDLGQAGQPRSSSFNSNEQELIKVYPNPADALVNFELDELLFVSDEVEFKVTDALGRLIEERMVSSQNPFFVINTSQWDSGIYHYTLNSNKKELGNGTFEVVR